MEKTITLVREKREEAQITMSELARRLDMPRWILYKIETGTRRLLAQEVIPFAEAIGCQPVDLLPCRKETR